MTPSEEQVRAAVAHQAGTWFIANQSGSLEQNERAAFVAWLKASPIHVEEYLGVALVAHDLPAAADDPAMPLESLLELARSDDSDRRRTDSRHSFPSRSRLRSGLGRRSMVICDVDCCHGALLAASVLWWMRDGEFLGLPKTYQTAHGEQTVAQLPDGTELRLNTDSAVTVRYTRSERVVEIARGQALFTVARDDHRRFRVAAGDVHVLAVGTQFDSYRKPDATIVTVVEGSVAVLSWKAAAAAGDRNSARCTARQCRISGAR